MMAYQVVLNRPGLYRILLEERQEGTYVNIFDDINSKGPYKDYLQDDLEMAMRACQRRFGVSREQWEVVPDESWH